MQDINVEISELLEPQELQWRGGGELHINQSRSHRSKPFVEGAPVQGPPVPLQVSTQRYSSWQSQCQSEREGDWISFIFSRDTEGEEGKGRMWADFTVHCKLSFLLHPKCPDSHRPIFSPQWTCSKQNTNDCTTLYKITLNQTLYFKLYFPIDSKDWISTGQAKLRPHVTHTAEVSMSKSACLLASLDTWSFIWPCPLLCPTPLNKQARWVSMLLLYVTALCSEATGIK